MQLVIIIKINIIITKNILNIIIDEQYGYQFMSNEYEDHKNHCGNMISESLSFDGIRREWLFGSYIQTGVALAVLDLLLRQH